MDVFESGEDPQCHFPEEKKDDQPISSINFWGTAFQTQPLSQDSFCAKVHLGGQPKAWSSCWAPWLGYFISGAWPSLGTGDFFWCSQTCQWTKYWPWSTAFLERNLSSGNFATRISANHLARLGFAGVVMVIIIIILSCADCDSLFSHCSIHPLGNLEGMV